MPPEVLVWRRHRAAGNTSADFGGDPSEANGFSKGLCNNEGEAFYSAYQLSGDGPEVHWYVKTSTRYYQGACCCISQEEQVDTEG